MHRTMIATLLALAGAAHADSIKSATASVDVGGSTVDAADDGNSAESTLGVSGAASAVLPYRNSSSFARGTAAAAVRVGTDGPGVAFQQEAHVRPYAFELFQFELGDRIAIEQAPKLSDRPDRWRRRYDEGELDVDVIFAQWIGEHWGVQFCRCDNGFGSATQHDGDAADQHSLQTADWAPLAITRRRDGEEVARLDPMALEARGIGGDHSGVVLTTWVPRLSGLVLGPVHLDLAVGEAATGWEQATVDDQVVSTITSNDLPVMHVPAARAHVRATLGRFDASAGFDRGMYLGQDAQLVVEERGTASLGTAFGSTTVTASGFAAHSVIWTSPTESSEHVSGGGLFAVGLELPDRWQLVNQAQLARTFYATVDGDRMPRVDTAFRLDLGLHREIANWVPR